MEMVNTPNREKMPNQSNKKSKNSLFSNVLGMMVILALLGILIVYVLEFFEKRSAAPDKQTNAGISFSIAASELQAPRHWVLTDISQNESAFSAIELEIPILLEGVKKQISVTLLPSSKAVPSAYLLDSLYIRKFDSTASGQSFGLIIKKLRNEAGFEDEEIWYDALSSTPFVAKCLSEKLAVKTGKNCISTVLVNKRVSALIKFEQDVMSNWREFSAAIGEQLKKLNSRS